ncbi:MULTISPECIES: glyoxalase superfamily protein [Alphaproteobacteria]|uniref:glyoxalase superfamily protein n=1 Tax=Alphaproteobacteria TaxID=28211 RepID=UPI003A927EF7
MTTADQAKSMARQLRAALSSDGMDISHSKSLELVAKTLGHSDWNTASAKLTQTRATPNEVRFTRCSPILRIFDEKKAREFYCDFLGFQIVFEHRFSDGMPLYLGLERGDLSLHLSEHHGDASPGANVFVSTANIREFHHELSEKQYAYNRPSLEDLPWGMQMQVNDPFGNRIRFCQQGE